MNLKNFQLLCSGVTALCAFTILAFSSCNRVYEEGEQAIPTASIVNRATPIYMATSVRVNPSRSSVSAVEAAENTVKQLRVLAFDSHTHRLAVNKFYDSNDQGLFSNQTADKDAVWHGAFAIIPGEYDFFFVANEDSWREVKAYLSGLQEGVATTEAMYNSVSVKDISYGSSDATKNKQMRTFSDGTDGNAEHLFLATRSYKNVVVSEERNGKGRQESDPQHFFAEGDEKVDLVRTLAKVKLHFLKAATVEADGNGSYRVKQFLPPRVNRLLVKNQMTHQSLFLNPFFESNVFPNAGAFSTATKYTADWYTPIADENVVIYDRSKTNDLTQTGLADGVQCDVKVPATGDVDLNQRYDCDIWFYAPERLVQAAGTDPAQPGYVEGTTHLTFEKMDGSFKQLGIWQSNFEDGAQKVYDKGADSKYFMLPNTGDYSKYSVVRNNVYDITVRYSATELRLNYKVLPWGEGAKTGNYVQDGFNIFVADRTFAENLTDIWLITASSRLLNGESITLKAKAGYKFIDTDGAEKDEVTYGNGTDENKFRHRRKIQFKSPASITAGTALFDVLSGGEVKYTVTATE